MWLFYVMASLLALLSACAAESVVGPFAPCDLINLLKFRCVDFCDYKLSDLVPCFKLPVHPGVIEKADRNAAGKTAINCPIGYNT